MPQILHEYADKSRLDGKTLKCSAGNKQCGQRCVPKASVCATEKKKGLSTAQKMGIGVGIATVATAGINIAAVAMEKAKEKAEAQDRERQAREYEKKVEDFNRQWNEARKQYQSGGQRYEDQKAQWEKEIAQTSRPWHSILGVKPNASDAEVKRAYQAKARQYHPDIYKGSDATERMQEINNARDEWKRRRRDSILFAMGLS